MNDKINKKIQSIKYYKDLRELKEKSKKELLQEVTEKVDTNTKRIDISAKLLDEVSKDVAIILDELKEFNNT